MNIDFEIATLLAADLLINEKAERDAREQAKKISEMLAQRLRASMVTEPIYHGAEQVIRITERDLVPSNLDDPVSIIDGNVVALRRTVSISRHIVESQFEEPWRYCGPGISILPEQNPISGFMLNEIAYSLSKRLVDAHNLKGCDRPYKLVELTGPQVFAELDPAGHSKPRAVKFFAYVELGLVWVPQ